MRALELDPDHFFKVGQEPVHHEHAYFSDYDAHSDESDDEYYGDLIGHGHHGADLQFSEDSNESNDIQFKINEDVQFKLSTDDNYEGRDIDVGITMPDDFPVGAGITAGYQSAPRAPRAPRMG